MADIKKIARVVSWVVAGLCVIVLILAVGVRVDQYLLRRNAERLLTDLKSLEMRKSTYRDARRVIAGTKRCTRKAHVNRTGVMFGSLWVIFLYVAKCSLQTVRGWNMCTNFWAGGLRGLTASFECERTSFGERGSPPT